MPVPSLRATVAALSLLALAAPAQALEDGKWCKLVNNSDKDWTLTITDLTVTVGDLLIRKDGETGDPLRLNNKKATAVIAKGGTYWLYFDTTGSALALTFKIGLGQEWTQINVKKSSLSNDYMTISTPRLSESRVGINLAAFRNKKGGTFLTSN